MQLQLRENLTVSMTKTHLLNDCTPEFSHQDRICASTKLRENFEIDISYAMVLP